MPENISFRSIVNDFVKLKPKAEGHPQPLKNEDLSNVHVKAEKYVPEGAQRETRVDAGNVQPGSTAPQVKVGRGNGATEVKSEQTLETLITVKIIVGTCEDLREKKMWIDLPFGKGRAEINLRQGEQDIVNSAVNVELESSYGHGSGAHSQDVSAKMPTEEVQKACTFLYKVYPKGKVLFNGGEVQLKTQTIIGHLVKHKPEVSSVKAFRQDGNGYYWLMEGICVVNQGVRHGHQWSVRP